MSDLPRGMNELVLKDTHLHKQYNEVQICEKEQQIKALKVMVENHKTIEVKRLEHQINVYKQEIENLKTENILLNKSVDVKEVK